MSEKFCGKNYLQDTTKVLVFIINKSKVHVTLKN